LRPSTGPRRAFAQDEVRDIDGPQFVQTDSPRTESCFEKALSRREVVGDRGWAQTALMAQEASVVSADLIDWMAALRLTQAGRHTPLTQLLKQPCQGLPITPTQQTLLFASLQEGADVLLTQVFGSPLSALQPLAPIGNQSDFPPTGLGGVTQTEKLGSEIINVGLQGAAAETADVYTGRIEGLDHVCPFL
jgi:hypothetical protein